MAVGTPSNRALLQFIVSMITYPAKTVKIRIGCQGRAIQFSSFSGHFREGRDSEIAPTEDRPEHQVRITGQLNGSGCQGYLVLGFLPILVKRSRFGDRSYSGEP